MSSESDFVAAWMERVLAYTASVQERLTRVRVAMEGEQYEFKHFTKDIFDTLGDTMGLVLGPWRGRSSAPDVFMAIGRDMSSYSHPYSIRAGTTHGDLAATDLVMLGPPQCVIPQAKVCVSPEEGSPGEFRIDVLNLEPPLMPGYYLGAVYDDQMLLAILHARIS